jgi:hypothetical protein
MKAAILAFLMLTLAVGSATAEEHNNVNKVMRGCRLLIANTGETGNEHFLRGLCLGEVYALLDVAPAMINGLKFCKPPGKTPEDALYIIAGYVGKPEPIGDDVDFLQMADAALVKAWPCK